MIRQTVIKTNSTNKMETSDPTSTTNVLKSFVKQHQLSLEELKKESSEISQKMERTETCIVEKNHENAQLKKQ